MPLQNPVYPILKDDLVEITSAQILALFTTPRTLVAAPGAGRYLRLEKVTLFFDKGAALYTVVAVTTMCIRFTNAGGYSLTGTVNGATILSLNQDGVFELRSDGNLSCFAAGTINEPLVLTLDGANPALGTGVIHARVLYSIVTSGL